MEIPHYPAVRPIDIADKLLLDRLFAELQPQISELTFSSLYLFRKAHDYVISLAGDSCIVLGRGYDGQSYALPPFSGDRFEAVKYLLSEGVPVYGLDRDTASRFLSEASGDLQYLRDSSDYLYLREDLAVLPGSRYHKKRNRIGYFEKRHSYAVEMFSDRHMQGCIELLCCWKNAQAGTATRSLELEYDAAAEAVVDAEKLGLHGVVVMVDGAVKAFALGEMLNRDTSVCHFEKADPFMEGLYQLINREFCRMLFLDCTYVNREQDLGDQGLRSAKLSYHPVKLVDKYLIQAAPAVSTIS